MVLLKRIALVLLALVVLLLVVSFLLPRHARVERTTVVAAPAANVFTIANGFRRFNEWSPWAAKDPMAKYTYSGPESGPGAKLAWVGDPKTVGSGSQTVLESRPNDLVRSELDFGDQGKAEARLQLAPQGPNTRVTWGFESDLGFNPIARWFGLFFDRMIGPDFEQGLANLKTVAEKGPKVDVAGLQAAVTTVVSTPIAFVEATSGTDTVSMAAAIGGAYAQIKLFMNANGLKQAGPPITIDREWEEAANHYAFDAGVAIDRLPTEPVAADSPVKLKGTYAGLVAKAAHRGPYRDMRRTYGQLFAWVALKGYQPAGTPWDEYVSDPGITPEADLITNIYLPIK